MGKAYDSFLQEATEDLEGGAVKALEFTQSEKFPLRLEWVLDGTTLKIHLFRFPKWKWPFDYAKTLYTLMDDLAAGEDRDIGYDDIPDSWYIISKNFAEGRLSKVSAAEHLCQSLLNRLTSSMSS